MNNKMLEEEKLIIEGCNAYEFSDEELLALIRSMPNYIEKIRKLEKSDIDKLEKIEQGEKSKVHIYLYRFKAESTIERINNSFQRFIGRLPELRSFLLNYKGKKVKIIARPQKNKTPIRDLSQISEDMQKSILGNLFLSLKKTNYNAYKKFPYGINFLKLAENDYLCIFSLSEEWEDLVVNTGLLSELFRVNKYTELNGKNPNTAGFHKTMNYWKEVQPPIQEGFKYFPYYSGEEQIERFELDEKLTSLVFGLINELNISISSILFTIWGIILAKYFNNNNIAIGSVNTTGKLKVAPVMIDTEQDIKKNLAEVNRQLKMFPEANGCTIEEIKHYFKIDEDKKMPMIQEIANLNQYAKWITDMKANEVCHAGVYNYEKVPLVLINIMKDNEFRMEYHYQEQIFSGEDISKLHECFVYILKDLLHTIESRSEIVLDVNKNQDKVLEANKIRIALYLKQCKLFKNFEFNTLLNISEKCSLVTCTNEEVILQQNTYCEQLYIIGDGIIESAAADDNNFWKSLKILKSGEMFGLESLIENQISKEQFTVYSNFAACVAIPRNVMKELMQTHSSVQSNLLEYVMNDLNRYKKLWLME